MFGSSSRNIWVLILLMLAGVVVGGFIGDYAGMLPYMSWLQYGSDFGLITPVTLDLGIFMVQFGFTIRFSICGIIGIIIAIIVYRKWM